MNNRWHIEGDYLVRSRGGLGDFDPNVIFERIMNLISVMQKENDGKTKYHTCFRKVAIEYGLKVNTVKEIYSFCRNKKVRCSHR